MQKISLKGRLGAVLAAIVITGPYGAAPSGTVLIFGFQARRQGHPDFILTHIFGENEAEFTVRGGRNRLARPGISAIKQPFMGADYGRARTGGRERRVAAGIRNSK